MMNAPPVQYVTTSDGVRIAYAATGGGRPLVLLPVPPIHTMEILWGFPGPMRSWLDGLAERFRLVQYDCRSVGQSTHVVEDLSLNAHVRDLEAVVQRLDLSRFVIVAASGFGHVAVRYVLAHPGRVEALILVSSPVSGSVWSRSAMNVDAVPESDWRVFLRRFVPPGLTQGETSRYLDATIRSCDQASVRAAIHVVMDSDVRELLPRVQTPTLVLHSRDLLEFPGEESIGFAALIPGARMVLLDGSELFGDHEQGLKAIDDFIESLPPGAADSTPGAMQQSAGLSEREIDVLRLIAAGKTNPQIADELFISRNTVQNHVSSILSKAGLANRAEAAAYAQRNGFV